MTLPSPASMKKLTRKIRRPCLLARCRRPFAAVLQMVTMLFWIVQPAMISKADQTTNNGVTLNVWASQTSVNPGDHVMVYAQLTDSLSSPLPYTYLNFTVVAGDGGLQSSYAYTDASGLCAIDFTAGSSSSQVNVFDNGGYGVATGCQINVVAPSSYQMWIGAAKNPLQAGQYTDVQVLIADSNTGAPLANAPVSFSTQGGDASVWALSATTDANGRCSVPVTCGAYPTQITATGAGTSNTFTLMCPSPGDQYTLTLSADQNPIAVNGTTTLRATCMDSNIGLPISGRSLSFVAAQGAFGSPSGPASSVTLITDDNGTCAVTYQTSQSSQVQVTDTVTNQSQSMTIGVQAASFQLGVSALQTTLQQGQSTTVYGTLTDASTGQPVSGATLSFQVASGDGTFAGGGNSWSGSSDATGTASATFTAGLYNSTIVVSENSYSGASQSLVIATLSSPPPSDPDTFVLTLSANDGAVLPGGTTMLHVNLTDTTTNTAISGAVITLQNVSGDGTFGPSSPMNVYLDGNGNCDIPYTCLLYTSPSPRD